MSSFYDDNHRLRIQMMEIMEDTIQKFDEETDNDEMMYISERMQRDEFSDCMKKFIKLMNDSVI